jgi:16S rRNA (cytosine967-C5)-methyltransferase
VIADPARRVAADVVLAVEEDAAYSNLLLPKLLRERGLNGTDAGFATELTYGTLRRQGSLDAVLAAGAKRDVASLQPGVRAVLRLGAYQLLHTRVPPHAAVSTTVELCRAVAGPKPAGLVNAVMRRVSERDWLGWVDQLAPADDVVGRLALEHGYPRWIAVAFEDALGSGEELASALVEDRPVTHLVARPGRITAAELLRLAGEGATMGRFSPYAVHLAGGDPATLRPVRAGRAAVQDEGSQLMALALASTPIEGRDERWLDPCAGPGGKAALLAGLLPAAGRLVAGDLHPHRAKLVAGSLGEDARSLVVVADAVAGGYADAAADRVLLDAPCSGLGALRRRPESRWRRQPEDVIRLQPLQRQLLHRALDAVRPGGVVAYVVCSPHPAETVSVVEAVRRERDDVELIDARQALPGVPDRGDRPWVQLWPHRHGTDGMFLSLLRRSELRSRSRRYDEESTNSVQ